MNFKKRKFNVEDKCQINRFSLKIEHLVQMQQIIHKKPNMSLCKNTITKEPFIKIHKIKSLRETTICQHPWKCRINQCYPKYFRNVLAILVRKVKVSTPILLLKILVIWIPSLEPMNLYLTTGKKEQ